MVWTIVGLALTIVMAVYSHISNENIKKLILKEKDMIRNKILDMVRIHQADINKVLNDRKTFDNPKLNEVRIRIEDLQADIDNLKQFAEELQKIK